MTDNSLTVDPNWRYLYPSITDNSDYQFNSGDVILDNKLKHKLNWDDFEGLDIEVGDETIHISKEEVADALFKLFPSLPPRFAAAMFDKLIKEAKC